MMVVMSAADSREAEVGATQSRQPHPRHSDRGGRDILTGQPGQLLAVAAMHHLLVSQSAVLYTTVSGSNAPSVSLSVCCTLHQNTHTQINGSYISSDNCLTSLVNGWSSKHAMHVQPEDISEAAILTSIRSLSDSAKLRGIAACSHLAQQSLRREGSYRPSWRGQDEVPHTLVKGLERLLDDASTIVHVPAAIALHCLGGQSQKVSS